MSFNIELLDNAASTEIKKDGFALDRFGISDWLRKREIISHTEEIRQYRDIRPWQRAGGETYSALLEFTTQSSTKQVLIKALTTLSPVKTLSDWARRRKILVENGVPVSNWYFYGEGVIIEDFYPNSVNQVAFEKVLDIGVNLDRLGFTTLKFTDDIRASAFGLPHFVDFGFDLGEPSSTPTQCAKLWMMAQFPTKSQEIASRYHNRY